MESNNEIHTSTNIVKEALQILMNQKSYSQATIRRKLDTLGHRVSAATMSNCIKNKHVGIKSLKILMTGLNKLIGEELGQRIDMKSGSIIENTSKHFQPNIVEEKNKVDANNYEIKVHEGGRLPISEKLAFWDNATSEIIELGVRLNTLTNSFFHRSDNEFKNRIVNILDRGVNIKLALLAPNHYKTEIYFKDRSEFIAEEANSQSVIEGSIASLCEVINDINSLNTKGTIRLFKYKHIPYNNFNIVDARKTGGKMLVAHYLYGQRRALSPVIEVHRRHNFELYQLYLKSYRAIIKDAVRII